MPERGYTTVLPSLAKNTTLPYVRISLLNATNQNTESSSTEIKLGYATMPIGLQLTVHWERSALTVIDPIKNTYIQ